MAERHLKSVIERAETGPSSGDSHKRALDCADASGRQFNTLFDRLEADFLAEDPDGPVVMLKRFPTLSARFRK
jgi:hypothetical protein